MTTMPFGIVTPLTSTAFLQTLSIRPTVGKRRRDSFTTMSRYYIGMMASYVGVAWGGESVWLQTWGLNPKTLPMLFLQASQTRAQEISVPAPPPLCFVSNLPFGSGHTRHRWGQPQHLPTLLYLVGQTGINLILELLLHIGVGGQGIRYVAQGGAGGLITSEDKDKSLARISSSLNAEKRHKSTCKKLKPTVINPWEFRIPS